MFTIEFIPSRASFRAQTIGAAKRRVRYHTKSEYFDQQDHIVAIIDDQTGAVITADAPFLDWQSSDIRNLLVQHAAQASSDDTQYPTYADHYNRIPKTGGGYRYEVGQFVEYLRHGVRAGQSHGNKMQIKWDMQNHLKQRNIPVPTDKELADIVEQHLFFYLTSKPDAQVAVMTVRALSVEAFRRNVFDADIAKSLLSTATKHDLSIDDERAMHFKSLLYAAAHNLPDVDVALFAKRYPMMSLDTYRKEWRTVGYSRTGASA